jgi:hypothetical protein
MSGLMNFQEIIAGLGCKFEEDKGCIEQTCNDILLKSDCDNHNNLCFFDEYVMLYYFLKQEIKKKRTFLLLCK